MCNLYDIGPAPDQMDFGWEKEVAQLVGDRVYVAPGGEGVVVVSDEEISLQPRRMRWGFARAWSKAINNARDDKLNTSMWESAWQSRRCLIPVRRFFEWSGPKGSKTKHAISGNPKTWMWMAGVWEKTTSGCFFSMITTSASATMEPLHDRMPVILKTQELTPYLTSHENAKQMILPYDGQLSISPPPSSLEEQISLF